MEAVLGTQFYATSVAANPHAAARLRAMPAQRFADAMSAWVEGAKEVRARHVGHAAGSSRALPLSNTVALALKYGPCVMSFYAAAMSFQLAPW